MSSASTLGPPSYTDGTPTLPHRLPSPHPLMSTSPTTSTYTGSYIDDGIDLLPAPTARGFGLTNPSLYTPRSAHKGTAPAAWNEHVARAVAGDVRRSLARLRRVGDVQVRGLEDEAERERMGVVKVQAPVKWGTFVIRGELGRVIVVDAEGEFDSGVHGVGGDDVAGRKRWVRVGSGVEALSSTRRSDRGEGWAAMVGAQHEHLPPVAEPKLAYSHNDTVTISSPASPTAFLMTRGLSGWPSRTVSPRATSPTVPHAITWASTSVPQTPPTNTKRTSRSPANFPTSDRNAGRSSDGSDVGWGGSKSAPNPGWGSDSDCDDKDDKESWDGFERRKTASEVSVVGSVSDRSWPGSQDSERLRKRSRPNRPNRHAQPNRDTSQSSSKTRRERK
ncbi:uncharacterized protein EKO05_0009872 [Ascochyta rabiei]|uniref:uncharacterized protein n=1 Tax=Didymella rabiei TaxID=5454 RepID=UPI001900C52B|nr:uncharacterized protein EKO05_0009872 [Ascochyta rabiei]UPX19614.1 hypothetical protein EKO05_0009872 [Ascochyta rabiei]